jgi:ribosomal protein S27E
MTTRSCPWCGATLAVSPEVNEIRCDVCGGELEEEENG